MRVLLRRHVELRGRKGSFLSVSVFRETSESVELLHKYTFPMEKNAFPGLTHVCTVIYNANTSQVTGALCHVRVLMSPEIFQCMEESYF